MPLGAARSMYLERCGGCHGVQGVSASQVVPTLRRRAARFLCLPEGRAYLIRLPSIANSPLDDEEVAQLMNFVVFEMGAEGPLAASRYTPSEIAALRSKPLTQNGLWRYRRGLVDRLIVECGAPTDLRDYAGPGVASR
jgi:hypothetical protein